MLISVDDIRAVRHIAKNISDDRVEIYIKEAENLDIEPRIGAEFYQKLSNMGDIVLGEAEEYLKSQNDCTIAVENEKDLPVNECKFLNGGYYRDRNGVLKRMEGLKKALSYLAYSRFILQHSTHVTPFGLVNKTGDSSSAVSISTITALSAEARKIGDEYLSKTMEYWDEVKAVEDYELGKTKTRRRFLAIGD